MSEYEQGSFLEFCVQMLNRNPEKKRGYDIFHRLLDSGMAYAEIAYGRALELISVKDIPPAVGVALKTYERFEPIKKFVDTKLKTTNALASRASKTR
jgi:hypothetical protein